MDTVKGNRAIAEFMGWKFHTKEYNWNHSRISHATWTDNNKLGHYELQFHASWEWLMPVVQKIIKTECTDCAYPDCKPETCKHPKDTYWLRTFGMLDDEGNFMVRINRHPLFTSDSLIKATFEAVVYFIENLEK